MDGRATFAFLYRSDVGAIDRETWWRGAIPLVVGLAVLTALWFWLVRFTDPAVDTRGLMSFVAYLYMLVFAFAVLLIAISFYNLTAKRLHDRGRSGSLAGLLPLAIVIVGATHWIAPRAEGGLPIWGTVAVDIVAALIVLATIWECGAGPTRRLDAVS